MLFWGERCTINTDQLHPLVALGLNGSQAKTFLALINRGTSSIRETSKGSGLSRPETYRSMVSLEELGLIEKVISSPTKYKPLPLQEALTILVERKKKETEQLSKKAEEFYNQFKEITQLETEEFEDDFILIPDGESLLHKIEKMTDNASTNLCAMLSQKKLVKWLLNYDTIEKALARGLTIKILTEERLPELLPNYIVKLQQKYSFELRYTRIPISVSFRLYDEKEALLSTDSTADFWKSPAVWSRNPCLVELIRNYFNAAWYASMTPLQQEFKRDNRQFENLFANMKSGFAFNRIIYDKNSTAIDFLLLDANNSFLIMFGLSRDSLGKKATELFPRFDKNDAAVDALQQLSRGEQAKIEYYSDLTNKWYSLLGYSPERGYFALIVEDITANKVAEQALRLSEERFEQMVEQSPIVIEVYDKQGFQIKVNNAYEKLWSISKDFTLGKYNILKSEQVANSDWHQFVERAYGGEVVKVPDYEYDASLAFSIKEQPKTRWLTTILYPLKNESGVVTGIVVLHEDVTERKEAEKALMESEIKYGNIFQNISTGFAVCQIIFDKNEIPIDFRFIDINKTFERIIGLKRQMVLGKTAKELFPLFGEQYSEIINFCGQVAITGKAEKIDLLFKPLNIWLEISASSTEKGYFVAAFNDITKRNNIEQALKRKSDELNCILDTAPTIIFYKDKQGKFIQVNKAFADALTVSKEYLIGKTVFDLYSNDIAQHMTLDDLIVMESKKPKTGVIEPYNSPTGLRWIRTDKIPSFDEKGELDGIIGFSEDITEQKNAEDALKKSEYNYRRLFGNLRDAFVAVAMDGRITDANHAYEELLGYSLDELKHLTYVDLTPIKWHDMESRLVSEQIIPYGQSILYEKEYRRKDGKIIPVELLTYLLKDENGVNTGMATVVRDISERKRIEEKLKISEKTI
jgi:PAS domain S-box-containing protein